MFDQKYQVLLYWDEAIHCTGLLGQKCQGKAKIDQRKSKTLPLNIAISYPTFVMFPRAAQKITEKLEKRQGKIPEMASERMRILIRKFGLNILQSFSISGWDGPFLRGSDGFFTRPPFPTGTFGKWLAECLVFQTGTQNYFELDCVFSSHPVPSVFFHPPLVRLASLRVALSASRF